jgi:hypothetical protein
MGYMAHPGQTNDAVGHRRWILNSEADLMGTGSTATSNALYVVGGPVRTITPRWVPWPAQGYFPWQVEPSGRWSLSLHGASFEAHVSASINGTGLNVAPAPIKGSIGDNTISWQVTLPAKSNSVHRADLTVDVTVDGVHLSDGTVSSYSYSVTLFDATVPVDSAAPPGGHTVPVSPTGVMAHRNPGGIGVQWQASSDPTGEVLSYAVRATPFGRGSRGLHARFCRSTTTSCEVTRTVRKVAYRISVVARNSRGPSTATVALSPALRL